MEEENIQPQEKAGTVALIFSFIMPLIGIICYFENKKDVENPSAYLYAALGGFVLSIILHPFANLRISNASKILWKHYF